MSDDLVTTSDSSSSSFSEFESDDNETQDSSFTKLLENNKILLNKSEVHVVSVKKDVVKEKFKQIINKNVKKKKEPIKKIKQVKGKIRKLIDKPTKDKNVWQKKFCEYLDGTVSGKPVVNKVTENTPVDNGKTKENEASEILTESPVVGTKKLNQETEETKNLSDSQLQRLVLLEQLKLVRIQQNFYNSVLSKFS